MTLTLRLKIAQKPYTVWSLGPKALKYESLEPKGYRASGFKVQSRLLGGLGLQGRALFMHMGGCKNYGPFLGPDYNTAPIIQGTQNLGP